MANEFIARKGLIALEASQITGSLNVSGGITGSLQGTASLGLQNLTTASVSLNTITFTKGDGTTFPIVVNTGSSGGGGDNLGNHTATQDLNLATFNIKNLGVITGSGNAQVSVGTYNFGQELSSTFSITGSGLIVSSSTLPTNHYNMVKVGNIELLDLNSLVSSNTFLMHNVDRFLVASGSEPIDLFFTNNKLLDHNGTQFDIYGGGANYAVRITSASSIFNNQASFLSLATKATAVNITHFAGWSNAPTLPTSDIVYMDTGSLLLTTSSIRNFPTEVSRSAAAAGFGSGGGGGVTINNNVDNYLITATGTANTLNGEANLTFDGITLTNTGKSQFGGASVLNTTHQFKGSGSDSYASFLLLDPDGEEAFKLAGSMANSDFMVTIGDVNNAYNATKIEVDDPNSKINLKSKVYGTAYATNATTLGNNGLYDIGSRLATSWAVVGGPALIAGRIVYLSGSTQWAQAQANVSGSSYGMLGVVTDVESQNEILIQGTIQISGSALQSGMVGQPVYLSALTAGQVTLTAPSSSGHVVRTLGYIYKANSNIMYFNPDNSYIVRT